MITNPIKVKEDDNLLDTMKIIIDNKVSGVCVINEKKVLVGVLSEMDCLAAILESTYNNIGVGLVSEYMTKENIVVAHPSDDIINVAQDMLLKKHRRRPVIEDGKLVGQVSCRQLLTAVNKFNK
ncbi:CBS domain-containing protein [Colwellia sp. MB02u-18]|nr:CBS domain-containing protein [Colwellia sp. MB3u-45]MBA6267254.1 CBS domain-containing protein [Colwellia sp. MB3u-43]MBA6289928.1 CBS domain-containing protein [Colwellia sp. MB3u-4]MBA6297188.1 CBS domain-containing protein [Colwellia sp. MB02u-9]MBA6322866.1 CBS domain-containing protein [Colwellia sp. MB02u-19]MBA6324726.1 CBS domain-containing protein [Colwellia sp. MB02u-18]MBA6331083.1 CBS domain-containing protein [Colwellia sp. MB02u-12]MBA6345335.1 CBS domain-containing protein